MERRTVCFRLSGAPARPFLKGRPFLHPTFPPRQTKIRRANSEALLPAGQTASNTHTGSAPCPCRARQRHSTRRRRQAPAIEPAAVCTRARRKRNAPQPVCPLLVGQAGVYFEPTALEAGTAGPAGSARTRSRDPSLENPFLGNGSRFPQRRRRQAPARGLAAVYPRHRPKRNEPQQPCPLLVGQGCVYLRPKALAPGTAGLARWSWSPGVRRWRSAGKMPRRC